LPAKACKIPVNRDVNLKFLIDNKFSRNWKEFLFYDGEPRDKPVFFPYLTTFLCLIILLAVICSHYNLDYPVPFPSLASLFLVPPKTFSSITIPQKSYLPIDSRQLSPNKQNNLKKNSNSP